MTSPFSLLQSGPIVLMGVLSFFLPAGSASAATFEIQKVTCIKASESGDGDELRVHITADGKKVTLSKSMKTGQVWTINRKFDYKTKLSVQLTEYDPLLPDENLGAKVLNPESSTGAWVFKAHGATYYVHFNVSSGHFGYLLRLHSLKAVKTQEGNGDDIYMKTYKDTASAVRSNVTRMRPGQVWNIKKDIHFYTRGAVTFHEEDPLNPDDQLGGLTVAGAATGGLRTRTFTRNGTTYVLTYEVIKKTTW